ncbi:hypothetical protein ABGS66_13600, partial [Acinetobacter haemolyticus]
MLFKNILSPITNILSLGSSNSQGSSSSVNTVSTIKQVHVEESTTTNNSNSGTQVDDGLFNGIAAGNGDQNYGIGVGNGDGLNFTYPFTTAFHSLGNSYSWLGEASPVTSVNTSTTSSSVHIEDNDTTDNSSLGISAGNGSNGGFLNGIGSGNGEHNYGIGNGNGDDVNVTTPVTVPFEALGNSFAAIGGGDVNSINTTPTSSTTVIED